MFSFRRPGVLSDARFRIKGTVPLSRRSSRGTVPFSLAQKLGQSPCVARENRDIPLAALSYRCFRGEVVKKWGQAPHRMPLSRVYASRFGASPHFFTTSDRKATFGGLRGKDCGYQPWVCRDICRIGSRPASPTHPRAAVRMGGRRQSVKTVLWLFAVKFEGGRGTGCCDPFA